MEGDGAVQELLQRIERLHEIGSALSSERDHSRLLELILDSARELTNADGGTLYLVRDDDTVAFEIMRTDSLGFALGGPSGDPVPFAPLALHVDGEPDLSMVVTSCVLRRRTIRIEDAYNASTYDLDGTRAFDRHTGYRTRSLLTVPMTDHENRVIGVLQLINAMRDGVAVAFEPADERLVESLASQAAIALSNKHLIDQQRELFEAFVRLIAEAIDQKSPYTGAHCRRVPELTMMLADAADATERGPLAEFALDADDRYALYLAAWLHDCGKITTPEHVMDKEAKLQTVHDRIDEVATRFAVLRREVAAEAAVRATAARTAGREDEATAVELERDARLAELDEELEFLRRANRGAESMSDADRTRLRAIAARRWTAADGSEQPLLSEEEVANLGIGRGTLNDDEREIIKNHVVATINMLEQLPFPPHLQRVPEYAAGHHERADGHGYPRGLTREQMSIPARAMAIADVFEALSAADRPYKQAKPLADCLEIMRAMRDEGHIDPDLFEVFVREGVFEAYARRHLAPEQLQAVDPDRVLRGPSA